jgi:hypothetical protein
LCAVRVEAMKRFQIDLRCQTWSHDGRSLPFSGVRLPSRIVISRYSCSHRVLRGGLGPWNESPALAMSLGLDQHLGSSCRQFCISPLRTTITKRQPRACCLIEFSWPPLACGLLQPTAKTEGSIATARMKTARRLAPPDSSRIAAALLRASSSPGLPGSSR